MVTHSTGGKTLRSKVMAQGCLLARVLEEMVGHTFGHTGVLGQSEGPISILDMS